MSKNPLKLTQNSGRPGNKLNPAMWGDTFQTFNSPPPKPNPHLTKHIPNHPPMTTNDHLTWASAPWTSVPGPSTAPIGVHKTLPYLPPSRGGTALHTLDIWLPSTPTTTTTTTTTTGTLPSGPGTWLVYIHGGAWRDPAVTAASFSAAASRLLQRAAEESAQPLAGIASLNYRLSPHPAHPAPGDPARAAAHPDHIQDVLAGLGFLQGLGVRGRYVLAGHSCGATLAFQAVMDPRRWGLGAEVVKPAVVVGFNGLYDLAGFIRAPPEGWEGLVEPYEEFTTRAFGPEENVWRAVCPATAEGWVPEWDGEGRKRVVLVQSREDTLVPYSQLESMKVYLERWTEKVKTEVVEVEGGGDHDDMWGRGDKMAEVLWNAMLGV
ncbi:Alpha/Beta hydrolase protein [Lasiosphaeria hispida]|uniref:Kynurenine formamidase n=1 Tax=Lasiosphaeria hispida TaxID=260671 RepID=A0AAJ0H9C2_9PEZI|nr:Alpha/Beta hydrolase protein [Lasiosphaeria hispida]